MGLLSPVVCLPCWLH